MHPFRGGIAHFLETMYHGLQARGWRTSAFTFTTQYPEMLFPGKSQFEEGAVHDPVPARRILSTVNPATWARTAREIELLHPDVLVFKYWMPFFAPSFGLIARHLRRKGVHVVAVVDNAIPHEHRPGDERLSRFLLRSCDRLIVMSESVEEDIRVLGIQKPVARIQHPIYDLFGEAPSREEGRRRLGIPESGPVLLSFGFIRRYKGLLTLLDAMPAVLKELPDARLLVAGEFYEDAGPYHAAIRRNNLQQNVLLHTDYIPTERVGDYFAAADVVVQPYVSATQSGVAQIAFHFEKPLIVTDVGGLAEIVPDGEAGLVVPPEDPPALAAAIVRYFKENMAGRLSEGVRREKPKYSWDRLYEAVEGAV